MAEPLSLVPRVVAPRPTRVPESLLRLVVELLRFTCGVAELRLVAELLRFTCGVAELRLVAELLELRLTDGAAELCERETAADWLLLLVLPP